MEKQRQDNSQKLKKFLRDEFNLTGLRARTIKCKNPIIELWLPYDSNLVLPNVVRESAVLANYGVSSLEDTGVMDKNNIVYGNTRPKSISIRYSEIEEFLFNLNNLLKEHSK